MLVGHLTGDYQVIPNRSELVVGEALEQRGALGGQRTVELGCQAPSEAGELDHYFATVSGPPYSSDQASGLESIDERGRGGRRQPGCLGQLTGGHRAVEQPVQTPEIGPV